MFPRRKQKKSVVIQAGETLRERIAEGDELLSLTEDGAINWRYEGTDCQVVMPTDESQGIGLFQTIRYTEDEMHEVKRYFFTATGIRDAYTVLFTKDELERIDEESMDELVALTDGTVSDEDEAAFFEMFFSPFKS